MWINGDQLVIKNIIKNVLNKEEYDICLIDESSAGWDKLYNGFESAMGDLAKFTFKYAEKIKKKIIFQEKEKEIKKNLEISKKNFTKNIFHQILI